MIHIEGNECKVGNANGSLLLEEASKAFIAVYETLKKELPKQFSERQLMDYMLSEFCHNITNYVSELKGVSKSTEHSSDALDKYFGDLFGK